VQCLFEHFTVAGLALLSWNFQVQDWHSWWWYSKNIQSKRHIQQLPRSDNCWTLLYSVLPSGYKILRRKQLNF
jgi:hypothetical protein